MDATLPLLRLPVPVADGPLYSEREILDDIVARWCGRLLQVGHPGRGITWVEETPPGHRSVHCYVRAGSTVAPFVAEVLTMLSVPGVPGAQVSVDQAAGAPRGLTWPGCLPLARRAHVVSAHVLTNYLRFHDGLLLAQPEVREVTRELCDRAGRDRGQVAGPGRSRQPAAQRVRGLPARVGPRPHGGRAGRACGDRGQARRRAQPADHRLAAAFTRPWNRFLPARNRGGGAGAARRTGMRACGCRSLAGRDAGPWHRSGP